MINKAINRLKDLVEKIPSDLKNISEEEFSMRSDPSKWSKKQLLGHLIDSVANNHQRFIRTQYENTPSLSYEQNKWNELNHYQELESKQLIQLWTSYNQHLVEIIKRIPEENLKRECYISIEKKVNLGFLIDDYVLHLEHHLHQIVNYT